MRPAKELRSVSGLCGANHDDQAMLHSLPPVSSPSSASPLQIKWIIVVAVLLIAALVLFGLYKLTGGNTPYI